MLALLRRGEGCNPASPISGQSEMARSCACSRPPTLFSSHELWKNDWSATAAYYQQSLSVVQGCLSSPLSDRRSSVWASTHGRPELIALPLRKQQNLCSLDRSPMRTFVGT